MPSNHRIKSNFNDNNVEIKQNLGLGAKCCFKY